MRKLIFLLGVIIGVMLTIVVVSIGCSESGSSEADINAMVQAEVANQLAYLDSDIATEVTTQLADLDELTVSNLYITDEWGGILANLTNSDGMGSLYLYDGLGHDVAFIGGTEHGGGKVSVSDAYGPEVASMTAGSEGGHVSVSDWLGGTVAEMDGANGNISLFNFEGVTIALIANNDNDGLFILQNEYDDVIAEMGAWWSKDGYIRISDTLGHTTFLAVTDPY